MKRSGIFKSLLLTSAGLMALGAPAHADNFNIPGGDLKTALDTYAAQSGQELLYAGNAVKGVTSKGVKGEISPDQALTRLLSGTGFSIRRDQSGAIAIVHGRSSSANEINPLQLAQAAVPTGRIEEVLVTARKREEAVENIPISITALNSEDLKQFGVRNFADLEGVVPGLNLGGGGNGVKKDSSPFIRGVGQRETKVTLDPAVGTYIDGIYIGRASGAMLDVTDVASIQVLRGPQGTLFGRNATGGAISVTLNKPNNNWEANVTANIGNYGRRDISGMINLPFVEDMLMGRLFISSTNSNGYFTNVVDNTKWGGDNRVSGIAQLRFLPTDNITIDLLGERTRIRETPRPQKCAFIRNPGYTTIQSQITGFGDGYPGFYFNTFEDYCRESAALPQSQFASDLAIGDRLQPKGRYWVDTSTLGGTISWDIGDIGPFTGLSAKSISAWRKTLQIADEDLDGVAAPTLMRVQPHFDRTTQLSQELQFSGRTFNDRLFLSTGFYFFAERTPQNYLDLSAGVSPEYPSEVTGLPDGWYNVLFTEGAEEILQTSNKAYAWYGQADFEITKEIELSAGIRWTQEDRWSRYSKAYADPRSVFGGVLFAIQNQGLGSAVYTVPGITPIADWAYGTFVYTVDETPSGTLLNPDPTFVEGKYMGDELSTTDVAWTPMFNLKYKFDQRMLDRFSLDQAMFYATYSQGFHAGGVTAGAVDYDQINMNFFNDPNATGTPCPNNLNGCFMAKLAEEGGGTADPQIFKPEKVVNYEVGFKLAALDRRLQTNLSAFYMNYTDMQITATAARLGIPIPYIDNIGSSVIKGIEWEIVALPTPEWRILLNGTYTDADIKEWNSQQTILHPFTGLDTGIRYMIDRSGERMPRVPRWQLFASSDYSFRLPGGGTITPSVAVRFSSSIYHGFDRGSWVYSLGGLYYNHDGDLPPTLVRPDWWQDPGNVEPSPYEDPAGLGYDPVVTPSADAKWTTTSRPTAFIDARMTWISDDAKMEAAIWGKNLTNIDDYLVGGIPLADVTGGVGMVFANPRTFGLSFTYHFGE